MEQQTEKREERETERERGGRERCREASIGPEKMPKSATESKRRRGGEGEKECGAVTTSK